MQHQVACRGTQLQVEELCKDRQATAKHKRTQPRPAGRRGAYHRPWSAQSPPLCSTLCSVSGSV